MLIKNFQKRKFLIKKLKKCLEGEPFRTPVVGKGLVYLKEIHVRIPIIFISNFPPPEELKENLLVVNSTQL